MPTVAELERLEALAARLTPLASRTRGELILAEDWNVVVGALIEVARAVLAEEREGLVPPHDHPDQVGTGWLDPNLRALLERGPMADPAAMARLSELERRLGNLRSRIDEMNEGVKEARDRVTDVATRDLTRQADITSVRRMVEGLSDSRDDVRGLRETLRSIQENVRLAVEVGSGLQVDGEPVDMEAWTGRLRELESFRERLRTPSGELLDAGALENRLTELTNTLVTEDELDAALESRPGRILPEQLEALEEKLRAALISDFETSMNRLADEIRTETSQRLAEVDALVARAVSDALPDVEKSVLSTVRPEISAAVQGGLEQSQAFFEKALAETEAELREEFGQQIGDVQRSIGASVQAELDRQLPAQLDPIRSEVASLSKRVGQNEATLAKHDQILRDLTRDVAAVPQNAAIARGELEQKLLSELNASEEALRAELELGIQAADEAITERLRQEVQVAASQAAAVEISAAETRLGEEARQAAKNEFVALLDRLPKIVAEEVMVVLKGIPDLLPSDFTRINGIGPTFDARLKAANVRTFSQLAVMAPEQIAKIVGLSVERIISENWIGQAKRLAGIR